MLRDPNSIGPEQGWMWGRTTFLLPRVLLKCKKSQSSCGPKPPSQETTRLGHSTLTPEGRESFPVIHHTPVARQGTEFHAYGCTGLDFGPHSQIEMFIPATIPLGTIIPILVMETQGLSNNSCGTAGRSPTFQVRALSQAPAACPLIVVPRVFPVLFALKCSISPWAYFQVRQSWLTSSSAPTAPQGKGTFAFLWPCSSGHV